MINKKVVVEIEFPIPESGYAFDNFWKYGGISLNEIKQEIRDIMENTDTGLAKYSTLKINSIVIKDIE